MNLARVRKLSKLGTQTVIDVLNNTRTIREAAGELKVSTKAVYDYMHAHEIVRHCFYFSANHRGPIAKSIIPPVVDEEGMSR